VVDKCLRGFEGLTNQFVAICCRLLRAESRLKPLAGIAGASRSLFAQFEPASAPRPSSDAIIGICDSQNLPRRRIAENTCETYFGENYQPRLAQRPILPLRRFAKDMQSDLSAIANAIKTPWSNGQCEGQINRLKTLKRQMYGRAKVDLLEARLLWPVRRC
jgi:hypothetical protein